MAMMQVKFLLMCGCVLPALAITGPICSSNLAQSTASCTIVNGVYDLGLINADTHWSVNGQPIEDYRYADVYTFTISHSETEFNETKTIVVNPNSGATYECTATFSQPSDVANYAPDYFKTCSIIMASAPTTTGEVTSASAEKTTTTICSSSSSNSINYQCEPNMKNLAVYEEQLDIMMNLLTDPQSVTWSVLPSSDEYNLQNIIDIGCIRNPLLSDFFEVKEAGLVINKATVTGAPISTAGLYVGKCADSTDNVGAKLLVIHTGPQCSRTSIDTSSSGVSCNITFADSVIHPIHPIVTWSLNGEFLASYTLQMERIIGDVFYAESTIATNGGASDNYQCEVTFDAPDEIQYPWIATNAPEFKEFCSITG